MEEGTSGVIQSPNYPNQLPHRVACAWGVQGPQDRRIKIEFDDLDLPGTSTHVWNNRTYYWCRTGLRVSEIIFPTVNIVKLLRLSEGP